MSNASRPAWMPVDFHMFSAPIGTAQSGYAEFVETMANLLPPPNHVLDPHLGIGPGAAHTGPYAAELGESVRRLHLRERAFYASSDAAIAAGAVVCYAPVRNDLAHEIASMLREGDVLLTLGAGDITLVGADVRRLREGA